MRMFLLLLVGMLAMRLALATGAGSTILQMPHYWLRHYNAEYATDGQSRLTHAERLQEVTGAWRRFAQTERALRAARQELAGEVIERDLPAALAKVGITPQRVAAQSTAVYTLQIAAYRTRSALRRFLACPEWRGRGYFKGTGIYDDVEKGARFGYGDESLAYKTDPLYLLPAEGVTRVRYGLYLTPADAARDAAVWRRRLGVTPFITRVPFTTTLTDRVLWGALPGVYTPPVWK